MKPVFKNPNDKRLRAGWRILLFIVIFWLLSAIILVIKPLFGEITKREYVQDFSIVIVFILAMVTFGWIELTGFSFAAEAPLPFSIADVGQYMSVMSTGVLIIIFIECVLVGYWLEFLPGTHLRVCR